MRELWEIRSQLFHYGNAAADNALGIHIFMITCCDFFLFPKLKEDIKKTHFQDSEAGKTDMMREL